MESEVLIAAEQVQKAIDALEQFDFGTSIQQSTNSSKDQVQEVTNDILKSYSETVKIRVHNEFFGLGPIEDLIPRTEITEILINGPEQIWIEINGRLQKYDDHFFSDITYRNFIERICLQAKVHANHEYPSCDGSFGNFRLALIRENITQGHCHLSLRRHPENPWNFKRLSESGWCSTEKVNLLQTLISQRKNFLVIGSTGSGKTSILNAFLGLLPECERAILIEDASELKIPNPVSMKLLTRNDPQKILSPIHQADLVKRSLRLRPDRIVMGEIRGEEAKDFLMSLATGHSGSFGTLHAQNPHQALLRLEMLIQLGAPQWSLQSIRRLIQLSLQYIVVTQKISDGSRKFAGLYRLSSLEEHGFLIEPINDISLLQDFQ